MRKYYNESLVVDKGNINKILEELIAEEINSVDELESFIEKFSEIMMIVDELEGRKYILMTRFATEEKYSKEFNEFYEEVVAISEPIASKIREKIYGTPFFKELPEERYENYKKILSIDIEMFEEKNIPLQVKEMELANKSGEIFSKMTVEFKGKTYTLSQMDKFLKDSDREVREEAWKLIRNRINEDHGELEELFEQLKTLRIEIAKNKGYTNYRDYKHDEMGRTSYKPQDLFKFHDAVEKIIVPILKEIHEEKRKKLGVETLRPWDLSVDPDGTVLKPFKNGKDLLEKSYSVLGKINPEYRKNLEKMDELDLFDLENREGKAPGGYNCSLAETKAPFIFMNAVDSQGDMVTMMHESGHAMHSFALKDEAILEYCDVPSEVAELASMTMEMLTMEFWDIFYSDENELRKAKLEQLYSGIEILPWVMIIDSFQHWIYTTPNHTIEERDEKFGEIMDRFNTGVDWSGITVEKQRAWLRQLHVFEVPFYYIEYGISQLGALSIYKNYINDKAGTLKKYKDFLKLGYSKSVGEIYETAGIKFDFSEETVEKLGNFIREELNKL